MMMDPVHELAVVCFFLIPCRSLDVSLRFLAQKMMDVPGYRLLETGILLLVRKAVMAGRCDRWSTAVLAFHP
jgi:hypothetical protein